MTDTDGPRRPVHTSALPTLLVIGAMKSATSALHEYLDAHPQVGMSRLKELNFFNGPERPPHGDRDSWWVTGQWHRGLEWYAAQFDPEAPARGESSPAYTSPSFPGTADRMADVLPQVRLLYLVRDPFERALSQYAHHHCDGAETRPVAQALLDPGSHYVSRSRYLERLQPYLACFDRSQIHVVVQERLLRHRKEQMQAVYEHVRVDPEQRVDGLDERHNLGAARPEPEPSVRQGFGELVRGDLEGLRAFLDDDLEEWSTR